MFYRLGNNNQTDLGDEKEGGIRDGGIDEGENRDREREGVKGIFIF